METGYTIKAVANMTGLSAHVIRAWEKRYGALSPNRSDTGRRLYLAEDIDKLKWVQCAIAGGYSVGQVAHLSIDEIRSLNGMKSAASPPAQINETPTPTFDDCLTAAREINGEKLDDLMQRAVLKLGARKFIEAFAAPLMESVGSHWRAGDVKVAEEHLITASVRSQLGKLLSSSNSPEEAPMIVFTTLQGQVHELGALMAAVIASQSGWKTSFLGPNMPANEIAGAVIAARARALGLSFTHSGDFECALNELEDLFQLLPVGITVMAGGRCVEKFNKVLEDRGALICVGLTQFQDELEQIN